jgi:hypothetical protein
MAETRLTNVIVPEVFDPYVREQIVAKNRFWRSGILQTDEDIAENLRGGGQTFQIPFWKPGSDTDEIPSETVAVTINPITADKEIAVRQLRVMSWGANTIAHSLAGSDPMAAIGSYVADHWAGRLQANAIAILNGIIADNVANDSSDLIHDIAIEDGDNAADANLISAEAVIDAMFLHGDDHDKFQVVAMHSTVYKTLVKANLIDFDPDNEQNLGFGTYLGLGVVVDDGMPAVAGSTSGYKYDTVFFKPGAFRGSLEPGVVQESEVERDPGKGAGIDYLHTRRQFCIHPTGWKWVDADTAGPYPVNTELDDATSWDRVYQQKNTGVVVLRTNG